MNNPLILTVAVLGLAVSLSPGEEKDAAFGHSTHGEAFDEGPRQEAVLIPGTGNIDFEVTTESGEAQKFFNQGVGQLHGFWDFEAERSFRKVATLDPDCAMAYWGLAMANHKNTKRAKEFIEEASERLKGAGKRERMWIESLAKYYEAKEDGNALNKEEKKAKRNEFVEDLEEIVAAYPKDVDAKAFLLLQIWRNSSEGIKIEDHEVPDLLAKEALELQPDHPIHHYRIHLWDKKTPARALESAALCGPAAPAVAHMWHMPGHIYSKLKRYGDAVWQQEASARIDHAHMMRYRIVPDDIHNFAHNNEWLIRNLVFIGRAEDAVDLACNMIELPRLAKFKKDTEEYQHGGGSWTYGRIRLRDALIRHEMWDRLLAFGASDYLEPGIDAINEFEWNRFMAIAAYESGKPEVGAKHFAAMEKILDDERAVRSKAAAADREAARKKKPTPAEVKAKNAAGKAKKKKMEAKQKARDEVMVYSLLFGSDPNPGEALKYFRRMGDIAKDRKARLMLAAGNKEEAVRLAEEAVKAGEGQVVPLATQVAILWECDRKEEARSAFEALRKVSGYADRDLPVFDGVKPVARSMEIEGDWRQVAAPAEDLGERPELDSLGPFRWEPPAAPGWSLANAEGKTVSLADYRGRPVLMIFYLGKGCTHCMEQLSAFAPMYEKYKEAGIDIVAVSTDSPEGLKITYQIAADDAKNPFPFPLVSDEGLGVFKEYRAYDDFEEMALHGTFLIDANGKIRWQDIGPEPFMHSNFLLGECERLLEIEGKAVTLSGR